MKKHKRYYPVNCKNFYMPPFKSKTTYRQGYCQKITDMCLLLDNKHAVCLLQEEWPEGVLLKLKPKVVEWY